MERQDYIYNIAQNPHTHPKTLSVLSESSDFIVRCGVAENANTPASVLQHMAMEEKNPQVLRKLAGNANLPEISICRLSQGDDYYTLHLLASLPHTPASALAVLGKTRYYMVREVVARNPRTSPATLAELGEDSILAVAS